MTALGVRILLVADTHLGFDLPLRPRVERRRRGPDFFSNFERALEPALRGEADLVVHGGDLLYRSRVPPSLVEMAMAPLIRVAEHGIPVYLVPGNHERSRIPLQLWATHENLHVFREPKTFLCCVRGLTVAVAGFPCRRNEVRDAFPGLVEATGYHGLDSDVRLLCIHQTVEGAQVGPNDYTFRYGRDIVRGSDIPGDFAAVLAGHIHRNQVLTHDLRGRELAAPAIYPGSVERTAFVERFEGKHYALVEVAPTDRGSGRLAKVTFVALPTRPMVSIEIDVTGMGADALVERVQAELSPLQPDSVVRIRLNGERSPDALRYVTAASVRVLAPPTMNVEVR